MTTPAGAAPLIEAPILDRLERLQLATHRPLAGRFAGDHRSKRHGTSLDFADYRDYHPGDDYRRIDYHLYARIGVLLLRLYEAEDDLTVRLLVDCSASMATGGKLLAASRLAGALGFVSLLRRDVVTVHRFPGTRSPVRFTGRGDHHALFGHLSSLDAGGGTDISAAVADLLARPGPRGITVLLSDLLTPDWGSALRRLPARGSDVVVVHMLSREDIEPVLVGDVDLVDSETGERVPVSLSPRTLAAYTELASNWVDEVRDRARWAGAAYVRVLADDDLESVLFGTWRREAILR